MRYVFELVVAPDVTEERYARPTVAVVLVPAVVAVGQKSTRSTCEPLAPAVSALKISVATVPPPWLEVFAAVMRIEPMFAALVKFGSIFEAMKSPWRSSVVEG
jgi:hypothetical protein